MNKTKVQMNKTKVQMNKKNLKSHFIQIVSLSNIIKNGYCLGLLTAEKLVASVF